MKIFETNPATFGITGYLGLFATQTPTNRRVTVNLLTPSYGSEKIRLKYTVHFKMLFFCPYIIFLGARLPQDL